MKRIALLMFFLIIGLISSQIIPLSFPDLPENFYFLRQFLTMTLLSFIMIEVGKEFEINFKEKKKYIKDYLVAATAATFPWIFVFIYFMLFLLPETSLSGKPLWVETLLAARFAAPTSAGVLFSMLAQAGLSKTWVFNKTRNLAIFDDLDTVLLMIPLQILIVGFVWQLAGVLLAMLLMVIFSLRYFKKLSIPQHWTWILFYGFLITAISEGLYYFTKDPTTKIGLHIEILLPAFLLGCSLKKEAHPHEEENSHVQIIISSVFLFLVGFSMPLIFGQDLGSLTISSLLFHTLVVTVISNLGKMFAFLCYKDEASWKERLAVSVAMFPRGEVGAGVLAVAIGYGISGPFMTVAFLSLALNLLLTGFFISVVKKLLS